MWRCTYTVVCVYNHMYLVLILPSKTILDHGTEKFEQYSGTSLLWTHGDHNKCPEYGGFLITEVKMILQSILNKEVFLVWRVQIERFHSRPLHLQDLGLEVFYCNGATNRSLIHEFYGWSLFTLDEPDLSCWLIPPNLLWRAFWTVSCMKGMLCWDQLSIDFTEADWILRYLLESI